MPFAFAASQLAGSLPSRLQIDLPRLARAIGVAETFHYDQHIAKPLIYAASDLAALRTDDHRAHASIAPGSLRVQYHAKFNANA
jgi:hypothetical protein